MNDLLSAILLGIVEGITEFLPISSDGHLAIGEGTTHGVRLDAQIPLGEAS